VFDTDSLRSLISEHWGSAGNILKIALGKAFSSGSALLTLAMNLLLVPVIMFYLLRDWDRMVAWIGNQLPRRYLPTLQELAQETDTVLGQFIRGQFSVMVVEGLIYVVGLWAIGLNLALVIGVIAGLVS